MSVRKKRLRAIDLYSGVGGWSVGLQLAGFDVVASYERWGPANETNFKNNRHLAQTVDIRRLALEDLPQNIDVVVGSPPCTEFSYSNRGGQGAISDGLFDIVRFLTIVDHLRPRYWLMENVPRARVFVEQEMARHGRLHKFAHLGMSAITVNMADFGLPQRRIRSLIGNIDFALLSQYRSVAPRRTLNDVISSLRADPVRDPLFDICLPTTQVTDHVPELGFSDEEVRINRAAKQRHPIYNAMSFPDQLDRPARTITATCTRVSRESIVIEDPARQGLFRRLTIRERAMLQGFPITYQFYGSGVEQKLTMIGNAIPPYFSYQIAHAIQGTTPRALPSVPGRARGLQVPSPPAKSAKPYTAGRTYKADRRFRFAIPSLHLKSGVRFELVNCFLGNNVAWRIDFYFGTSRAISTLRLDGNQHKLLTKVMSKEVLTPVAREISTMRRQILSSDLKRLQQVWSHRGPGGASPFMLLDQLDAVSARLQRVLNESHDLAGRIVSMCLRAEYGPSFEKLPGLAKVLRNAPTVAAGILLGTFANELLERAIPIKESARAKRSL